MQIRNVIGAASLAAAVLLAQPAAAQTYLVKATAAAEAVSFNGTLFFSNPYNERGLWKSDATAAGTQLVKASDYDVTSLTPCGDQLFFNMGSATGQQLWRTDGTVAGTTFVYQLTNNGDGYVYPVRGGCSGRTFYFSAPHPRPQSSSFQYDLFRTDGTSAGTFLLATDVGSMAVTASAGNRFYFTTNDYYPSPALWTTDGTVAGTRHLTDLGDRVSPQVAVLGSRLIFSQPSFAARALWSTDGTVAGTVVLATNVFTPPAMLGTKALFFQQGLWQTDGTVAGTTAIRWPMSLSTFNPPAPAVSSGRFFFLSAGTNDTGDSLWKSDGTDAGTTKFVANSGAMTLTDADGVLLFSNGASTFVTDGTSAPVSIGSFMPQAIVKAGTHAFLLANGLYAYDLSFAAASLSPRVVAMSGGTAVTIAGTGFDSATAVAVDGVAVTPSSWTPASITFNAPAHAQGQADVVVTRAGGQQARMSAALTFVCDTTPVAVASGATTVCPRTPVPLTGSGGVTCSWVPATGLSDSTSCTPTAAPSQTTTYRLTVTNASGCASTNAADVVVTVPPAANTNITLNLATTYGGDSTATVPATAGATYHWSLTNGTILSDPNQRAVAFRTACSTARLEVTATANGCPVTSGVDILPLFSRTVTGMSPTQGSAGTTIVIRGTGFTCATAVRIGVRVITTNFHIDSDTQITMTSAGAGRIDVLINDVWVRGQYFLEFRPPSQGDVDADGKPDIVFRNPSTGVDAVWQMNGTSLTGVTNIVTFANADYHIVGMANFDGDWSNDLLLHNRVTGANGIWKMAYFTYQTVTNLPAIADTNFELEGTGDFNGDGKPDILIRNQVTGANAVWLMNGTTLQSTANLPALPNASYRMAGSGDFNGDGKTDLVWRNASTGENAVWLMDGTAYIGTLALPALPNSGYAIGAIADYNADGKPDLVWRNASTGANAIWLLNGGTLVSTVNLPPVNIPEMEMAGPR